jgi:hypothetical protein
MLQYSIGFGRLNNLGHLFSGQVDTKQVDHATAEDPKPRIALARSDVRQGQVSVPTDELLDRKIPPPRQEGSTAFCPPEGCNGGEATKDGRIYIAMIAAEDE